jgi:peptidoglycan/LPS O-acetylase OafA/YrhL
LGQDVHHSIKAIKGLRCSAHLDLLRGLDAVMVVLVHLSDLFFQLSKDNPSFLSKAAMFLVVQGISSVLTFFVLSGYLISMSIFDPLRANRFSWRAYIINRLSRLYVVLVPALLLGAFWDLLGIRLFGLNSAYNGVTLGSINVPPSVVSYLTWQNFFGQLLFLQDICCHTFGSNGVLWSLSCEFWYYLIFPAALISIYPGKTKLPVRIGLAVFAMAALCFIGPLMCYRFVIWLMGTALLFVPLAKSLKATVNGRWLAITLGAICFIVRLWLTPLVGPSPLWRIPLEFLLGLSCMLCLFFVLHDKAKIIPDSTDSELATPGEDIETDKNKSQPGPFSYVAMSGLLASFSYSLYLVHMPFLFFLRACLIKDNRWPLDALHIFYGLLLLALVLFYAWLVALCTENQTAKVRALFMKLTGKKA